MTQSSITPFLHPPTCSPFDSPIKSALFLKENSHKLSTTSAEYNTTPKALTKESTPLHRTTAMGDINATTQQPNTKGTLLTIPNDAALNFGRENDPEPGGTTPR